MRIARVALIGCSLALLAGACSFPIGAPRSPASSRSSPASPRPAGSPASSPGGSAVEITSVKLAKDFIYGDVVDPTSTFSPGDRQFHLVVDLSNAVPGTTVGDAWYAVDAGSHKNEKLDSQTYTLKNGEGRVHFTLTNEDNWPKGRYRAQVMLNGKLSRTLDFRVQQ